MTESIVETHFGKDHAAVYDERWKSMAPMAEGLHFLLRMVLSALSSEARVLCVGVGTGTELITLARNFPRFRFTAVDPSGPMLAVCRKKVEEAGMTSRCDFHEGYLDSLPDTGLHDAATSIFVSQFLTIPEQRRDFFVQIAQRLRSGAYLINADLASPLHSEQFESLFDVWLRTQGAQPGSVKASDTGWGTKVAVSIPEEIESIIASAGFQQPILFYQALFMHAWYARRQ